MIRPKTRWRLGHIQVERKIAKCKGVRLNAPTHLGVRLGHLPRRVRAEAVSTADALDRVLAEPLTAPSSLPTFPRSTVDGYAVRATDTFGASESLPAYLSVVKCPWAALPT
jgi:molybdopterin biosynthesis enzyme